MLEIATARSDLREFLSGRAGVDVIEADQHHALITHTKNAAARAKLIRDLVAAGFEVSSFGESTRALEDAYFKQVGQGSS
jgi:ABC-2 type transport system ATP-binding protein